MQPTLNLVAIRSHEVLQVLICISCIFECSWDVINFTAILMQINFIHFIDFQVTS